MTTWQKISLLMAVVTVIFMAGIGISIAELNITWLLISLLGAILTPEVGSLPCRSVSQGVDTRLCLPKTAWPPTF